MMTVRGGLALYRSLQPPESFAEKVEQRDVFVPVEGLGDLPMTLYTPLGEEPSTSLLLIHGGTPLGRSDPRLRSLACALALAGMTVACPQLDALAAFTVEPADIDRLVAACTDLARQPGTEQLAMVGISLGGSYGVIAAGRPELAGRLSTMITFGAAADLDTSVIEWLAEPDHDREEALAARRTLILANLHNLVPLDDVDTVNLAILAASEASPGAAATEPSTLALSDAGRLVLAVARDPAAADGDTVRRVFEPLLPQLRALSPASAALPSDLTIYLAHAVADPLVPVEQLSQLAYLLDEAGASVHLEVTEIFTHVDSVSDPNWFAALPLARFFGRFLDEADG
ncbi:MAG: hypothetical protein ACI9EF_000732 [Pseudohongiellaceae bacterium]